MTRSSTNELFTPYKEPEREFQSSRRHFKTLSLDELRSPDFNLLSVQEYSEEEEAEAMAETMEQYISKTRTDYGSGVAWPKIDNKDQFELKGQFLKELQENTFSGSDNEDANEHIEKVLEIVDLFHVPNITILDSRGAAPTKTAEDAKKDIQEMAEYSQKWHNGTSRGRSTKTPDGLAAIQAQLNNLGREIKKVNDKVYVAQLGCVQCKRPHHTKDFPLKEEGKPLEEAYYTQFGGPFQGGGYRATTPCKSVKRQEENSNLIKEIRATTDAAIRNQRASIKTLEIQIGQMSKVLQERGFRSLPSQLKRTQEIKSSRFQPLLKLIHTRYAVLDHPNTPYPLDKNNKLLYKSRKMTIPFPSRLDNHYCDEEEGNYGLNFVEAYGASHINGTIPRKEKDPKRFTLP
ncbi:hypothetical protein Tco_1472916 [Tanacetum coccineum]